MITLDEWIAHLEAAEIALVPALEVVVAETAELMAEAARGFIGHEQGPVSITSPVPFYMGAWEPLAASTMAEKRRLGIDAQDGAPLYRTGQMKISIRAGVVGLTGVIGSDDEAALYQEMGTATIPPRPFLARGVIVGLPVLDIRLVKVSRDMLIPRSERKSV